MNAVYHRQILARALGARVSPRALKAIYRANVWQDRPSALIGHPEFHFDENAFAESLAYVEECRALAAGAESPAEAWAAFGRLSHTVQDFYAHSNYVALWMEQFNGRTPPVEAMDGLDPALLKHPRLMTCCLYLPLEALSLIPDLRPVLKRFLPKDSHTWMNLDNPGTGPLFPFAMEAAIQRTAAEFDRTLALMGEERGEAAVEAFCDRSP